MQAGKPMQPGGGVQAGKPMQPGKWARQLKRKAQPMLCCRTRGVAAAHQNMRNRTLGEKPTIQYTYRGIVLDWHISRRFGPRVSPQAPRPKVKVPECLPPQQNITASSPAAQHPPCLPSTSPKQALTSIVQMVASRKL